MNSKIANYLLFVGAYFPANIFAVEWMAKHIAGRIDRKILVVGSGMDRLVSLQSEGLEVRGRVEELGPYYELADAVLLPIFFGTGMCTKTVEALRFGKALIASPLSLRGLPLPLPAGIKICGSADDWRAACTGPHPNWGEWGRLNQEYCRAHLSFESKIVRFRQMLGADAKDDRVSQAI